MHSPRGDLIGLVNLGVHLFRGCPVAHIGRGHGGDTARARRVLRLSGWAHAQSSASYGGGAVLVFCQTVDGAVVRQGRRDGQ